MEKNSLKIVNIYPLLEEKYKFKYKKKYEKIKATKIIKLILILLLFIIIIYIIFSYNQYLKISSLIKEFLNVNENSINKGNRRRIGVIGILNDQNPGNNLIKFSMYTKLKEFGFDPFIISKIRKNNDIYFLKKMVKLKIINETFSELNENDYDYIMLNSDQSWTRSTLSQVDKIAFLKFAENWTIPKFIYAASTDANYWMLTKRENEEGKRILKNFKGISFREKYMKILAEQNLDIKAEFVLDPTFLIDKNYYLDLIKDYKRNFNFNEKYILVYQLDRNINIEIFIQKVIKMFNYKIYNISIDDKNYIENFIFGINISQCVVTDSYHGTVFSIIFNKPFVSFGNKRRGIGRFESLKKTFNIKNRFITPFSNYNDIINALSEPLNINQTLLEELKNKSIKFLKSCLDIN